MNVTRVESGFNPSLLTRIGGSCERGVTVKVIMDFGASYIYPVEYAQICHGRHSRHLLVPHRCVRAAQSRYTNNCERSELSGLFNGTDFLYNYI